MDNDPIFSPGDQKVIGQAGLIPSPGMANRIYFVMMLGLVLLVVWVVLGLRAKSKYDQVKQETELVYIVTPINQEMTAFLTEVQSSWTSKAEETDGPESEMIKLAGMTPSVTNLINVFSYQMPPYAWFSSEQNRKAAALALIKAKFMPVSVDKRWHLSEDQHLAVLHCKTNVVFVYRDEATGLRAMLYVKLKNKAAASPPVRKNAL